MPDNGGYAIAAYVAAAVVYIAYAATIHVRLRALQGRARDIADRERSTT
ncbi:MAG: hypothetical protein JWM95_3559 [Gemmatimonadetes bacterium]|nr:hypothetical protein [Gemmatimonadota bacterium]